MAFNQFRHLVTQKLEVADGGVINFDVANSTPVALSPIPVAFTPTGGGTGVTVDGDAFYGRYTLIGNMCYFSYQVVFTNITNFGTGQYFMDLPVPALKPVMMRNGCLHDANTGHQYHISGHVNEGETRMNLFTTDRQGNRVYDFPFAQGEPVTLTTADTFHIEGFYEADLS